MSGYSVSNGKVYDPNGNVFVARGVDIIHGTNDPTTAQLQADFPGINFVRLAIYNYDSPASLATYVNSLTSAGIVVELENHANNAGNAGGGQGTIFTGQTLTTEQNWYSSVASYFKSNPNVWFGTNNEPSETNANGQNDPAALSAWQQTTYNTIRATGNNAPVLLETTSWGPSGTNIGYNAADYAGMHNVIWDQHYYGWVSGYSTDQTTVTNTLNGIVSSLASIKSADGVMPTIIGEYGNSTTGQAIDANGTQVVNAVQTDVLNGTVAGSVAWSWGTGYPGDGLTTSSGGVSSYGQQVAAGIAKEAAANPSPPPTPSTPPSASGSVVLAGSTGVITDASGNKWTIANGAVDKNGTAAGYSSGVKEIAYVNGTVWQENTAGTWWSWNGSGWPGNGTTTSPVPALPTPSANDTVVKAGSTAAITDASGNAWTLNNGVVQENSKAAGYSSGVSEIAYANGTIYQENASGTWWAWNGSGWPGNGTSTSPLPAPVVSDTIKLTAGGTTTTVTAPKTVSGDTFSLTSTGATNAVLGSTPSFIQFTGTSGVNVTGGSVPAVVTAAAGTNTFTAGAGYLDVTGGSGADAYAFNSTSKFLSIEDFSAAKGDTLSVASSLQAGMQTFSDGHNTMLVFGNGSVIDLHGVAAAPTLHWN